MSRITEGKAGRGGGRIKEKKGTSRLAPRKSALNTPSGIQDTLWECIRYTILANAPEISRVLAAVSNLVQK